MKVVAYVPDLMDRSKVPADVFVSRAASLPDHHDADVYVVDLSRAGALEAVAALRGRRIVGFASHVNTELIEAARAAGCEVYRRSEFFRDPAAVLNRP